MTFKARLFFVPLALLISFTQPAKAVDPMVGGLLVGGGTAAALYGVAKVCQMFLVKGQTKSESARSLKQASALQVSKNEAMENRLKFAVDGLNEDPGYLIELSLESHSELYSEVSPSTANLGHEMQSLAKNISGAAAIAYAEHRIGADKITPARVIQEIERPVSGDKLGETASKRIELIPAAWPLRVVPIDRERGAFEAGMKMALYASGDKSYVIFTGSTEFSYNEVADRRYADLAIVKNRLHDWALELEVLKHIHVSFEMQTGQHNQSVMLLGPMRQKFGIISVTGAQSSEDEVTAQLYLLRKLAGLVKNEALNKSPVYRDAYVNEVTKLEREYEAIQQELNRKPSGGIQIAY